GRRGCGRERVHAAGLPKSGIRNGCGKRRRRSAVRDGYRHRGAERQCEKPSGNSGVRVVGIPRALRVSRRGGRAKEEPMSYDLRLFRLPPGADPREAFARLSEAEEQDALAGDAAHRTAQDDSARAGMERLAGLLTARHPAFERFHPQRPLPWIELNDEARQVQVTISAESVGITMPYFRQESSE